jgi:hypothetical protein
MQFIARPNPSAFAGDMVKNPKQHRKPVIRAVVSVIRGNSGRGRKTFLVAGFVFL